MGYIPRLAPHIAKIPENPIFSLLPKLNEPGFISFAPGAPDAGTFPYNDIARIASHLLESNPEKLLQYGSTEGFPAARSAMADLISRYGLSPRQDEVIITTGGQQAIDILCNMFMEPGDVALVESPTYSATLQILKSHRSQVIPLESDEHGFIPEDLDEKIKIFNPKIVYLIPTFKNPSGTTISYERRVAAAEITGRYNTLLIEDDPYRDLRYAGEHLPTIKSFDTCGNIVFITSTSKILCPGLRVGAAYLPDSLIPAMTVAKQVADMHSTTLSQAIVSEFINCGLLEPHIERVCRVYRGKLELMRSAIAEFFPESIQTTAPQGGLFVFCTCPENIKTAELLNQALALNISYIPGDQFYCDCSGKNTFRLNFSSASIDDIPKGIEILGRFFRERI